MSSSILANFPCDSCHCRKSHKLPFSESTLTSSLPLEIIYSDVWSSPIHLHDAFKYYVIFVDHFTRYICFYPLKRKSDIYDVFTHYKPLVEKFFKRSIVTIYTDNGGEYEALKHFLSTHGITLLASPPHTPKHNGFSERCCRHYIWKLVSHYFIMHPFLLIFGLMLLQLPCISSIVCQKSSSP